PRQSAPGAFAMNKYDWMELETLSGQVAHAQKRLDAARTNGNHGAVRLVEREIAETEARRARVLADLTKGIGDAPSGERHPTDIAAQPQMQPAEEKSHRSTKAQVTPPAELSSQDPLPDINAPKGETRMWDKLTAADLELVKRGLANRRSEMLARHATDLKALEAEQSEIDVVEKAIAAFTQKFKLTSTAEVLPLEAERDRKSVV